MILKLNILIWKFKSTTETNLDICNITLITTTNDIFEKEKRHYATIFFRSNTVSDDQEAVVVEPHKCEGWEWVELDKLTQLEPLFLPLGNFLKLYSPQKIVQ